MRIDRCVDGDTCRGFDEYQIQRILRLQGVDATETAKGTCPAQSYAEEARKALNSWVMGKVLQVAIFDTDIYGRYVVQLIDPDTGESYNERLLKEGYAFAYRRPSKETPDLKWAKELEAVAEKQKKGLWSLKERPQAPSKHRKLRLNCRR